MKLRTRLALTMIVIAVPVVLGLSWFSLASRRRALLESTYEVTVQRMEAGGRERCEAGRLPVPRLRARRGRAPRVRRVYDDAFVPLMPKWGPLEPELQRALEAGDPVSAQWLDRARRVRVAMRMPWDGPCSVIVVERSVGPMFGRAVFVSSLAWSSLAAALTVLVALLALGPAVRRIRRLTVSVRAQAAGGYEDDVEVRGSDEVADLAQAFNEAGAEIRKRLHELSARDQALTDFLANTTHDVMIPLTVLQGHLSDLATALREGRPADPAQVAGALSEAHYVGSLLRNLSVAARLDAGEPMLARHRFDLRDVIERAVSRHRPIATGAGVSLDHAVPDCAVEVEADSTLAEQALSNLVSNAVRYNARGGHVAVVLELREGGRFEARVADDGPGIPKDELARVSERRFRGGAARQRSPSGAGLGLHIVRDVAHKHGWDLRFESPEEGGLRVRLSGALAPTTAEDNESLSRRSGTRSAASHQG